MGDIEQYMHLSSICLPPHCGGNLGEDTNARMRINTMGLYNNVDSTLGHTPNLIGYKYIDTTQLIIDDAGKNITDLVAAKAAAVSANTGTGTPSTTGNYNESVNNIATTVYDVDATTEVAAAAAAAAVEELIEEVHAHHYVNDLYTTDSFGKPNANNNKLDRLYQQDFKKYSGMVYMPCPDNEEKQGGADQTNLGICTTNGDNTTYMSDLLANDISDFEARPDGLSNDSYYAVALLDGAPSTTFFSKIENCKKWCKNNPECGGISIYYKRDPLSSNSAPRLHCKYFKKDIMTRDNKWRFLVPNTGFDTYIKNSHQYQSDPDKYLGLSSGSRINHENTIRPIIHNNGIVMQPPDTSDSSYASKELRNTVSVYESFDSQRPCKCFIIILFFIVLFYICTK
jgi:hypothetical protein